MPSSAIAQIWLKKVIQGQIRDPRGQKYGLYDQIASYVWIIACDPAFDSKKYLEFKNYTDVILEGH